LAGAFAMVLYALFLQGCSSLTGAFACACIGARALTTHGQTAAMAESTVATNVHQTLDVHGCFASQVTFNGELGDLIANFFQIPVGQVLDLLGISDATSFADFASAGATDSKDGCEANFRMLLRRNIDASDTCHFRPLKLLQLTLTLLVTRICTDHTHNALAPDNFAVTANFLDRSRNFHISLLKTFAMFRL
jgi:hypothetical protein